MRSPSKSKQQRKASAPDGNDTRPSRSSRLSVCVHCGATISPYSPRAPNASKPCSTDCEGLQRSRKSGRRRPQMILKSSVKKPTTISAAHAAMKKRTIAAAVATRPRRKRYASTSTSERTNTIAGISGARKSSIVLGRCALAIVVSKTYTGRCTGSRCSMTAMPIALSTMS